MATNDNPTDPPPSDKLSALTLNSITTPNNINGSRYGNGSRGKPLASHQITTLQTTIAALEAEISALTLTVSEKDDKIYQVQTFITEIAKRSKDKDESIRVLRDQIGKLGKKVGELEGRLAERERRVAELEEDLEEVRGF